jgi:hypothetical protein
MSPLKFVTSLCATKEKTVVSPLGPLKRFQVDPAMVGVDTGDPVDDIGPAPPRAASQIMISYSDEPVALAAVNMSYDTSATISDPE